jgi:hypothetical protein
MGSLVDLSGKKFGKLLVIKRADRPKGVVSKGPYWLCQCDCGNIKIVYGACLKSGNTKSCGCLKPSHFVDLSGERFGRLLVIKQVDEGVKNKKARYANWLCECDCGNKVIISYHGLVITKTLSCGCYAKEVARRIHSLDEGESAFNLILQTYKRSAKKRNLDFLLSEDEFKNITQSNCFYCVCETKKPTYGKYKNGNYICNGIDRLDSNLGYTSENSVPCCSKCNFAKKRMTYDEFMDWVRLIYNFSIKRNEER